MSAWEGGREGREGKRERHWKIMGISVCVSTPVSKDTTLVFLIYPTSFSVQKQGATESLHGCRQRSSMQLTRISRLITVTYLQF